MTTEKRGDGIPRQRSGDNWRMARAGAATRKSARSVPFVLCLLLAALAVGAAVVASGSSPSAPTSTVSARRSTHGGCEGRRGDSADQHVHASAPETDLSGPAGRARPAARLRPTTTTAPTSTTLPLPAAAPGFVAGHVTAVGDSVMLDYQDPLQTDIPGITVDAAVSRQWSEGESILQQLKASGQLGSEVIVALSTNGPISDTDFDNMMAILSRRQPGRLREHPRRPAVAGPEQCGDRRRCRPLPQRVCGRLGHAGCPEPRVVRRRRYPPRHRRTGGRCAGQSRDVHPEQRVSGKDMGRPGRGSILSAGAMGIVGISQLRGYSSVG